MSGNAYTEDEIAILRKYKGSPSIAKKFLPNRTMRSIVQKCDLDGIHYPGRGIGYMRAIRVSNGDEERLRQMMLSNMAHSRIADAFGVTKGVIAGWIYRIKRTGFIEQEKPKPENPFAALPRNCCAWPDHVGDITRKAERFCGAKTARIGLPYCAEHMRTAYMERVR